VTLRPALGGVGYFSNEVRNSIPESRFFLPLEVWTIHSIPEAHFLPCLVGESASVFFSHSSLSSSFFLLLPWELRRGIFGVFVRVLGAGSRREDDPMNFFLETQKAQPVTPFCSKLEGKHCVGYDKQNKTKSLLQ